MIRYKFDIHVTKSQVGCQVNFNHRFHRFIREGEDRFSQIYADFSATSPRDAKVAEGRRGGGDYVKLTGAKGGRKGKGKTHNEATETAQRIQTGCIITVEDFAVMQL